MRSERGIALIVTMLVVALLTITVVEFTFSVGVDQRLVRNSLSAMQASMLARSGINLGEAVLARDTDKPQADWYFEDWANPDIAGVITLDPDERLKVQVIDESGKININRTRGPRVIPGAAPPATPPASKTPAAGASPLTAEAFLRDALRRLFEAQEVRVGIVDDLVDYWGKSPAPVPGSKQPPPPVEDFRSLEDFGATFGIPSAKLTKLSKWLTALPVVGAGNDGGKININTAPVEVLTAVLNDQQAIQDIVDRQGAEKPIEEAELKTLLKNVPNEPIMIKLFGTRSSYFRVFASAMVSADPTGQRHGGVGQTVVALVQRRPRPNVPPNAPPGTPRWTLTPLDWQKRGGAELFAHATEEERGAAPLDR
ncbi:MAG: general secretion pathway protein GspK [Deltaproteobacteria bacterium]|nr:general secretion pathway protein GspK [Deltaproteobacteria bacterium]MBI3389952.1 general secretion pathway protein GspK [Deltaproteobacteria bacterium]